MKHNNHSRHFCWMSYSRRNIRWFSLGTRIYPIPTMLKVRQKNVINQSLSSSKFISIDSQLLINQYRSSSLSVIFELLNIARDCFKLNRIRPYASSEINNTSCDNDVDNKIRCLSKFLGALNVATWNRDTNRYEYNQRECPIMIQYREKRFLDDTCPEAFLEREIEWFRMSSTRNISSLLQNDYYKNILRPSRRPFGILTNRSSAIG